MKRESILDMPHKRGKTWKERIAHLKAVFAEIDRDPELQEHIKEFIRRTT